MSILNKATRRAYSGARPLPVRRAAPRMRLGKPSLSDLPLQPLHEGQRRIRAEARRFNVCSLGRRFGKTELAKLLLCETAYVEGGRAAYCAPTNKALNEFWEELKAALFSVISHKSEANKRLYLNTGGVIECWSLEHPDRPRGRRYHRLVIDEAAQVKRFGYAWQQVLRATLIDYQGDAWFLSTPRGRNYFWQLFRKGNPANPARDEDWQSWQLSSHGNPFIPPGELDAIIKDLHERAVQEEIFAQFLEEGGTVFRRVREAACAEWQDEAIKGHEYIMGVDFARTEDWTVLTVIDTTDMALVHIDRFHQIDYRVQRGRIVGLYSRFKPTKMIMEANAMGLPNIEELQYEGYPAEAFFTTPQSKRVLIDTLIYAFEVGELLIPPDEGLIEELLAFEAERLPTGLIRYAAPENQHDDQVISLALAWAGVVAYAKDREGGVVVA